MSIIKNIKLAPEGKVKIQWVRHNMPILNSIETEFKKNKPFKGLTVSLSCHLEAKTAYLVEVFKAGGAKVVVTGSNSYSTKDEICAALASEGVEVFAIHGCSEKEQEKFLMEAAKLKPNVIIDDGGDMLDLIHSKMPEIAETVIGGCEETTTGVERLLEMDKKGLLKFPMMMINHADCKHLFDNRYGTGQSTFDAIDGTTNLNMAGRNIVIVGYGWCGRGLALRAKGLGGKVIVTEIDPVKAIEAAMEGYQVMPLKKACKIGDVFITATGRSHIIRKEHMILMKDGAIMANAGHFGYEIDREDLKAMAKRVYIARDNIEGFELENKKTLYIIVRGELVNIAAGNGHPADIMDMSFALQALNAKYVVENANKLGPHAIRVPKEIDKEVALRKLKAMGISIDK